MALADEKSVRMLAECSIFAGCILKKSLENIWWVLFDAWGELWRVSLALSVLHSLPASLYNIRHETMTISTKVNAPGNPVLDCSLRGDLWNTTSLMAINISVSKRPFWPVCLNCLRNLHSYRPPIAVFASLVAIKALVELLLEFSMCYT